MALFAHGHAVRRWTPLGRRGTRPALASLPFWQCRAERHDANRLSCCAGGRPHRAARRLLVFNCCTTITATVDDVVRRPRSAGEPRSRDKPAGQVHDLARHASCVEFKTTRRAPERPSRPATIACVLGRPVIDQHRHGALPAPGYTWNIAPAADLAAAWAMLLLRGGQLSSGVGGYARDPWAGGPDALRVRQPIAGGLPCSV